MNYYPTSQVANSAMIAPTVAGDFLALLTVTDSDATPTGFTPGQTVKVRVTAANNTGESLPST